MVAERITWPSAEELNQNSQNLLADVQARICAYEERFKISSDRLPEALASGELTETADIARWLICLSIYRKLVREQEARLE
jgi:hypothetical protein